MKKLPNISHLALSTTFLLILLCSCGGNGNKATTDSISEEEFANVEEDTDSPYYTPIEVTIGATNSIDGHEYVDLGLPSGTKWATCNLGASSSMEYGDYFAWGETSPKAPFVEDNCQTFGKDKQWLQTNGFIDGGGNLTLAHDAARQNWGATWRMPNQKDIEELIQNTTWEWIGERSVVGVVIKSKTNGNSIFLPAAGLRENTSYISDCQMGSYWTSTPNESSSDDSNFLIIDSDGLQDGFGFRYYGRSIRPVSD